MSLGGSILILYNIHGKILVLKKYSSTMIEGGKGHDDCERTNTLQTATLQGE